MSRIFLVTGAGAGIGLALSHRLAEAGHHVVGIARHAVVDFPGTMVALDLGDTAATQFRLDALAGETLFVDGGSIGKAAS